MHSLIQFLSGPCEVGITYSILQMWKLRSSKANNSRQLINSRATTNPGISFNFFKIQLKKMKYSLNIFYLDAASSKSLAYRKTLLEKALYRQKCLSVTEFQRVKY